MFPMIFCDVCMFDRETSIFLVDVSGSANRIASVPTNELSDALVNCCYSNNANKIHFVGQEEYINGIMAEIKVIEGLNYNLDKIEFEVN